MRGQDNMQKLRAGASTSVQKLGESIHICLSQDGDCLVSVVGANALNQAIKGIIVAKSLLLTDDNSDLVVQPNFVVVQQNNPRLGNSTTTSIELYVKKIKALEKPSDVSSVSDLTKPTVEEEDDRKN